MKCGEYKIDIGCGRVCLDGFIGIDKIQYIDGNGIKKVHIVRDIDKQGLPFCDDSAVHIRAYSFLEHIVDLEFVLNECWRVLTKDGILEGIVPYAGSDGSFRDPTHKRFFTESTFDYFTGKNLADDGLPEHPRYTRYGFLPWDKIEIWNEENGLVHFKMKPRK